MGKVQVHIPVLLTEVVTSFEELNNGVFVDATLGMGGHTREILEKIPNSSIIGIDLDSEAVMLARQNLLDFGNRVNIAQGNYVDMIQIARNFNELNVDGVLLDLGLSSVQIDDTKRGFSFRYDSCWNCHICLSTPTCRPFHTIVRHLCKNVHEPLGLRNLRHSS